MLPKLCLLSAIAMKCQNCNDQGCHLGGCQYCYLCSYCTATQGGFCDKYCKQAKIPYVKEWPKANSSKSGTMARWWGGDKTSKHLNCTLIMTVQNSRAVLHAHSIKTVYLYIVPFPSLLRFVISQNKQCDQKGPEFRTWSGSGPKCQKWSGIGPELGARSGFGFGMPLLRLNRLESLW